MSYAVTRRSYGVSFGEWADTHNILGAALLVCFFPRKGIEIRCIIDSIEYALGSDTLTFTTGKVFEYKGMGRVEMLADFTFECSRTEWVTVFESIADPRVTYARIAIPHMMRLHRTVSCYVMKAKTPHTNFFMGHRE